MLRAYPATRPRKHSCRVPCFVPAQPLSPPAGVTVSGLLRHAEQVVAENVTADPRLCPPAVLALRSNTASHGGRVRELDCIMQCFPGHVRVSQPGSGPAQTPATPAGTASGQAGQIDVWAMRADAQTGPLAPTQDAETGRRRGQGQDQVTAERKRRRSSEMAATRLVTDRATGPKPRWRQVSILAMPNESQ